MRRTVIVGTLLGVGVLMVRSSKLHERLMARCEGMFERMPDTFPPKKMMRGIEEVRVNSARILDLLEAGKEQTDEREVPGVFSAEGCTMALEERNKELELSQVRSALKMAGYVQQHAATITADEVARVLAERLGAATDEVTAR